MGNGYNLDAMESLFGWSRTSGEYDHGVWLRRTECGTVMCLAGKTVLDAGYEIRWDNSTDPEVMSAHASVCRRKGATEWVLISDAARQELGLTRYEEQWLFTPDLEDSIAARIDSDDRIDPDDQAELQQKFAREFFAYLLVRARREQPNMTPSDVDDWIADWEEDNDEALSGAYVG